MHWAEKYGLSLVTNTDIQINVQPSELTKSGKRVYHLSYRFLCKRCVIGYWYKQKVIQQKQCRAEGLKTFAMELFCY